MYKKKRKKYLRSSHVDSKREISLVLRKNGNRQPANAKKWRENRGQVVIFAVRVSRIQGGGGGGIQGNPKKGRHP